MKYNYLSNESSQLVVSNSLQVCVSNYPLIKRIKVQTVTLVDVDQMYGIEIVEFPARIAEVALWLIDHQMNMLFSTEFGKYYLRLPLQKSANIYHGNALRINWNTLLKPRLSVKTPFDSESKRMEFLFELYEKYTKSLFKKNV